MVKTIQRFFTFCGEENRHKFRLSIALGVLQAIFQALKIPAIACMARALLRGNVETKDILLSLGIMLLSILGSGLIKAKSTMLQTEAGYDTCAKSGWRSPSTCAISPWDISTKTPSGRLHPSQPMSWRTSKTWQPAW